MPAAPARSGHHIPVPATVRLSVLLWLTAVTAGAAEALVRLMLPEPPTPAQLWTRFAIYTALAVLVLALHTGRGAVRWAVAVLLGGIGTLSLVVEPAAWLLAGGSPTAFLAEADGSMLLITGLRVVHIAAVVRPLTRARTPRRLGAVVL